MATSKDADSSESAEDLDLKQCGIDVNTTLDKKRATFGFEERTSKTDLVLILEGKSLYVNRVVLEMVSPVFEKILSENLKESGENEMEIEGTDYYDFAEFLACFYPGKMHKISLENVYRILPLAYKYDLDYAKKTCESILAESLTSFTEEDLFKCMNVAYDYNIDDLKQRSLTLAVTLYAKNIYRVDEISGLRKDCKVDIYDALAPTLRSDACKYKFWCVAKNINGIQLEIFGNAKYVNVDTSIDVNKLFMTQSKLFTREIPPLWLGLKFKITFKAPSSEKWNMLTKRFESDDSIDFMVSFCDKSWNVTSRAAILLEFLNIVPGKQNLYIGNSLIVSSKETKFGAVKRPQLGSEKETFILNGKVTLRTHVLVNQPNNTQH